MGTPLLGTAFVVVVLTAAVVALLVDLRGRRPKSWVSEEALARARAGDEGRHGKGTLGAQTHDLGGL